MTVSKPGGAGRMSKHAGGSDDELDMSTQRANQMLALRNDSALCACHSPRKQLNLGIVLSKGPRRGSQLNLGIVSCIERGLQVWIHAALHDMP